MRCCNCSGTFLGKEFANAVTVVGVAIVVVESPPTDLEARDNYNRLS